MADAQVTQQMDKALDSLHHEMKTIRTGRANTGLLDNIRVDAYGQPTPLNQVASVSVPDPKTLMISPWDKSIMNDIEKGIQAGDLGFNPVNDGNVIRITIPELTEERREELKKIVRQKGEDAKIRVRNVRRDANEAVKKQLKDKEISEDDEKRELDSIQQLTDDYIKKIDESVKTKEQELSEI